MAYVINFLDILVLDGTLLDTNYTNHILYKDVLSNKFGMSHLIELHKTNRIILLTNTNKNRADELIKFL